MRIWCALRGGLWQPGEKMLVGMYLVALRHFCMDVAKGGPMNAIVLANIFGKYDPIEH